MYIIQGVLPSWYQFVDKKKPLPEIKFLPSDFENCDVFQLLT